MLSLIRDGIGYALVVLLATAIWGCGPAANDASRSGQTESHDHEGHDHEGHDHEGHDHEGHDHEGHDHDSHASDPAQPADFPAAVAAVRQHYEAIRDAFQANDVDKAHGPMHSVGALIETLPELAAKADLGEAELASVKSAAAAMFEAYGEIDDALHTGKQADYAAVADTLDKGMAELQAVLDGLTKKAEE